MTMLTVTASRPSSAVSLPSLRALQRPDTFNFGMISGLVGFVSIGLFDVAGRFKRDAPVVQTHSSRDRRGEWHGTARRARRA